MVTRDPHPFNADGDRRYSLAECRPPQWEQGVHMEALANLAHELRSPVQAILGYLDILRDEMSEALGDRHKQIIERMNANAHDLAQTVENVHGLFGRGRDGGSDRTKRKSTCTI